MDRAKIIETIRNLRAKAEDAASSEAEAAAAAMMLTRLMMKHDVEMALYLCELVRGASKRAWSNMGYEGANIKQKHLSFMTGFGTNIDSRLMAMAEERARMRTVQTASGGSGGTALVVVKKEIIKAKMAEMGLSLGRHRKDKRTTAKIDPTAFVQGQRCASNVNLNAPIGGAAEATGTLK